MKFIVGLGNPGKNYTFTRHNLGFMLVDEIARRHGSSFNELADVALVSRLEVDAEEVVLFKPQTYVNRSGLATRVLVDEFRASPE